MQSECDDSDRKKSHKQFGRYQAAKPPVGDVYRDGHRVRFVAQNNETYQIDLSKMQQRNLRTGKIRAVSCQGQAGWHFDKNATRGVPRWLPYARPLHRVLDAAYADVEKVTTEYPLAMPAVDPDIPHSSEVKKVRGVGQILHFSIFDCLVGGGGG